MSFQTTSLQTVGAYQQRLLNLDSGSEIRCRQGRFQLRFSETGAVFKMSPGQSIRVADRQMVMVESTESSQFWLAQPQTELNGQTQKNRQGLAALAARLWRSLATPA